MGPYAWFTIIYGAGTVSITSVRNITGKELCLFLVKMLFLNIPKIENIIGWILEMLQCFQLGLAIFCITKAA